MYLSGVDLAANGEPALSGITYHPFGGSVHGWSWSNGSQHRRERDQDAQLVGLNLADQELQLTHDAAGQIVSITDPSRHLTLSYDPLGRLPQADDSNTLAQTYQYDANGNRLRLNEGQAEPHYDIAQDSNRLLSSSGPDSRTYQYDAAGNIIADGLHTYHYDDANRLISIDDGETATYLHNGQGQRVEKRWWVDYDPDINADGKVDKHDRRPALRAGKTP